MVLPYESCGLEELLKGNFNGNIFSDSMDSVYTITHHTTFLVNKINIQRKSKLNMNKGK